MLESTVRPWISMHGRVPFKLPILSNPVFASLAAAAIKVISTLLYVFSIHLDLAMVVTKLLQIQSQPQYYKPI